MGEKVAVAWLIVAIAHACVCLRGRAPWRETDSVRYGMATYSCTRIDFSEVGLLC